VTGKGKLVDIYQSSPYLNKHRHLGYAMQWLLIAIAALMIGIFSVIRLDERDELLDT
jgi:surfeit locus 1 family protein